MAPQPQIPLLAAPDWLKTHGGSLRRAATGDSWLVLLAGEPQYKLVPVPAAGKHSCDVIQTINGRHLESTSVHPSLEQALQSGLEDLRKVLGW
jgi:hypothetical protein